MWLLSGYFVTATAAASGPARRVIRNAADGNCTRARDTGSRKEFLKFPTEAGRLRRDDRLTGFQAPLGCP